MPYANPDAQRAYQRRWVAERRARFFNGKACSWCGSGTDLRLHHRDPNKKVSHSIWSWGERRRDTELAKCDVICEPCHTSAHSHARRVEAELRNPHGTKQRYDLGCRCAGCREGRRQAARLEYARQRQRGPTLDTLGGKPDKETG